MRPGEAYCIFEDQEEGWRTFEEIRPSRVYFYLVPDGDRTYSLPLVSTDDIPGEEWFRRTLKHICLHEWTEDEIFQIDEFCDYYHTNPSTVMTIDDCINDLLRRGVVLTNFYSYLRIGPEPEETSEEEYKSDCEDSEEASKKDASQILAEVEKENTDHAVTSFDIKGEKYERRYQEQKLQTKKEVRQSRFAEKERDRVELVNVVKKNQEETKERQNAASVHSLLLTQMVDKLTRGIGEEKEEKDWRRVRDEEERRRREEEERRRRERDEEDRRRREEADRSRRGGGCKEKRKEEKETR
eukprot:TRINITY_DN3571_c0_g4_i3.p1 TRINITY_DN3571_c0_g4~~TRINITY_DN3571_c0_g4_i3.p1  ORF type:complete len:298 (-),score=75.76 TRINITY_DN3571_c0_g4_i3:188-1081(-)